MTAILDDMRRLDAAHARGDISARELAAAKADLIDAIPEATEHAPPDPAEAAAKPQASEGIGVGQILLLCAVILMVCVGATVLLTGDLMLSATLAITVLAAFTIMLFRQLDG